MEQKSTPTTTTNQAAPVKDPKAQAAPAEDPVETLLTHKLEWRMLDKFDWQPLVVQPCVMDAAERSRQECFQLVFDGFDGELHLHMGLREPQVMGFRKAARPEVPCHHITVAMGKSVHRLMAGPWGVRMAWRRTVFARGDGLPTVHTVHVDHPGTVSEFERDTHRRLVALLGPL